MGRNDDDGTGWLDATDPCTEMHPQFFALRDAADRERLRALRAATPEIAVTDTIRGQIGELARLREPWRRFTPEELTDAVDAALGETPPAAYGVWVYYPWSRRLVHLVGRDEFILLRTSRNRYKITDAEQETLGQRRVGVIGLSVGQSAALAIAMERGCGELRLADYDTLEVSNMNRLRAGVHALGLPKVAIAAREIAEIDPFLRVVCFPGGVTEATLDDFLLGGGRLDLLIEESDGMDIKFAARYRARAAGIPVVMETTDRGMLDVERFDREPSRPIFHGMVPEHPTHALRGLSTEEKVPIILPLVGAETISKRMKASLIEVEQSIPTWPQLASAVALGGALVADVARRIALDQFRSSGRFYADLETIIADAPSLPPPDASPLAPPAPIGGPVAMAASIGPDPDDGSLALASAQAARLVAAATHAPSGGNCQPWRWGRTARRLHLFADRAASNPFLDVDGLGTAVALGAAAENLILRAHADGLAVRLETAPEARGGAHMASFAFYPGSASPSGAEPHIVDDLAPEIARRQTNRGRGTGAPLAPDTLAAIQSAAESVPGARCYVLTDPTERAAAGELLGIADRMTLLNAPSHRASMAEVRWTADEAAATRDGIDFATLGLSPTDAMGMVMCRDWEAVRLVGEWRGGRALEQAGRRAAASASAIALLTMPAETRAAYFGGGRAMQRAWLAATRAGVAFQPYTALPYLFARLRRGGAAMSAAMRDELAAIRPRYHRLFGVGDDCGGVLLFRLALAPEPATRALRRDAPISDLS